MEVKLNCILLIDDNSHDNFFHEIVIRELNCVEKVAVAESGKEALDYLSAADKKLNPIPDLIFLDINMPAMNGWEFLDHYEQLPAKLKKGIVVVMLSTSINPDDKLKAEGLVSINQFSNKPLTVEILQDIIKAHFENRN